MRIAASSAGALRELASRWFHPVTPNPIRILKIPSQIILASRLELRPSPLQPRQFFDEDYINELALSVRGETGFINALVVRACQPDEAYPHAKFEIIAGECRWRSSDERPHPTEPTRLEAIDEIPVVVREMDDAAVLAAMLAENMDRRDLTPLEESDAFHRALAQQKPDGALVYAGYAALAAAIGVNPEVVRKRLSLRKLPAKGRKAMAAGELSFSVARVACGCPEKIVGEVLDHALHPEKHNVWLPGIGFPHEPLNAEQTELLIEEKFMRKLEYAPFDLKYEQLLPVSTNDAGERVEGGACEGCPWNTATQRGEARSARRPGSRGGEVAKCLNVPCYSRKVERHKEHTIFLAKQAGHAVLTGKDAEKILKGSPSQTLSYAYVDLDAEIAPEDLAKNAPKGKALKWGDVVMGEAESKVVTGRDDAGEATSQTLRGKVDVPVTVAIDDRGHAHRIVERKVAVAAAAKTKAAVKLNTSAGRGQSVQTEDAKAKKKKEQEEAKLRNEVTFAVVGEAMQAVARIDAKDKDLVAGFWAWMIDVARWHGSADAAHFVTKRLELKGADQHEAVKKHAKTLKEPGERRAFAVELLIARLVKFSGVGEANFRELCKLLKIDAKGIEKRVREEKKATSARGVATKPGKGAGEMELVIAALELRKKGDAAALNSQSLARALKISGAKGVKVFSAMDAELEKWHHVPWGELHESQRAVVREWDSSGEDCYFEDFEYVILPHEKKDVVVHERETKERPAPVSEFISPENYVFFAKLDKMKEAGEKISPVKVQSKCKLPGLRAAGLLISAWEKWRGEQGLPPAKAAKDKAPKGPKNSAGKGLSVADRAQIAAKQRARWAKAKKGGAK